MSSRKPRSPRRLTGRATNDVKANKRFGIKAWIKAKEEVKLWTESLVSSHGASHSERAEMYRALDNALAKFHEMEALYAAMLYKKASRYYKRKLSKG